MSTDLTEARALYARYRGELNSVGVQLLQLRRRQAGLMKMVEGLEILYPELPEGPRSDKGTAEAPNDPQATREPAVRPRRVIRPASREAVRALREHAGEWHTPESVHDILEAGGIEATLMAVRLGLRRAHERGEIAMQDEAGRQVFLADPEGLDVQGRPRLSSTSHLTVG